MSSTCCWLSEILINWYIKRHQLSRPQQLSSPSDPQQCIYIYIYNNDILVHTMIIMNPTIKKNSPTLHLFNTWTINHHQQSAICDPPIPISASSRSASTSAFCASDLAADSAATASSAATDSFTWSLGRWRLDLGGLATCFWGWTVLSTWKGYRLPQKMV